MPSQDDTTNRRRFLKIAGIGTAGFLAGCSGGDGGDGGGDGGDGGGDGGDGGGGESPTPTPSDEMTPTPTPSDEATPTPTPTATASDIEFPTQDVTIVIPYPPGGGFDSYCRLMANELNQMWDVSVTATNISGASGRIATEQVFNAKPDGHTFMLLDGDATPSQQVRRDVNYDNTEFTILGAPLTSVNITGVARFTGITSFEGFAEGMRNWEIINCSPGGRTGPGVLGPYLIGRDMGSWDPQQVLDNLLITSGSAGCVSANQRQDVHATTISSSSMTTEARLEIWEPLVHYSLQEENPYSDVAPNLKTLAQLFPDQQEKARGISGLLSGVWPWAGPPGIPDGPKRVLRESIWQVMNSDGWAASLQQAQLKHKPTRAAEAKEILVASLESFRANQDLLEELG